MTKGLTKGTRVEDLLTPRKGVIIEDYKGQGRYTVQWDGNKVPWSVPCIDVKKAKEGN